MNSNILDNFEKHVFYHGTSSEAAESIAQRGFCVWFEDDEYGRYHSGGNLGIGLYITCNWRMALMFGPTLLRVAIRPGTRFLNTALRPDGKILDYLQREFGREILRKPPWKVLPKNKKLKLGELIALFRYHYWHVWEKEYGTDREDDAKWPRRRELHFWLVDDFRNILIRYGFHGYGNPEDDNGIVVFAGDRLALKEVVAEFSPADYLTLEKGSFRQFRDVGEVKDYFQRHGSRRAKKMAEQVAAADAGKSRR
jgi:hypothetical protein